MFRFLALVGGLLAAESVLCADYSWHFGSGLLPWQVDPTMVSFGGSQDLRADGLHVISRPPDFSYYQQTDPDILVPEQFVLRTTLQVIDNLSEYPEIRSHAMFNANFGGFGMTVGIGDDVVYYLDGSSSNRLGSAILDTDDAFHEYRLEADTSQRTFSFYQDGNLVLNGVVPPLDYQVANVWFGDATQYAGGYTIWKSFEHNAAAVPEPATLLTLGLALGGLVIRRRNKRGSTV